jgi:4-amino-4-deoxy-L-arabinose transferase-like glycosyltransferase
MSKPNPPAPSPRADRWFFVAVVVFLGLYAVFLTRHATQVAGGADSSGYLNSARLLAAGQLQSTLRVPDVIAAAEPELNRVHFTPHGFFPHDDQAHLPPTYPPGIPLQFALAGKLLGWTVGPLAIELFSALGALGLCYLVGRECGLGRGMALAGAAALGLSPLFLFSSLQPLSDTPAATWSLAAMACALRLHRSGRLGWAAATGLTFAIAVLVRPTNTVLLPAILVLIGWHWRRLVAFGLAGLPAAVWLGYYNHTLYGEATRSGYGAWYSSFAASYFAPTAVHFVHWLALLLPAVLLPAAIAAVFWRDLRHRRLLALTLWFGAVAGLYAFYNVSHEAWWCLRFILPAFPPLIIAGLLALQQPARRWRGVTIAASIAVIAWSAIGSWHWTRQLGVLWTATYESAYQEAAETARRTLPPNALVVAGYISGAIYFYTDLPMLRWDLIEPADFKRYAATMAKAGRPIFAVIYEAEEKDALAGHVRGDWTRVGTVRNIGLWRLTSTP